eukprot:3848025-Amphidinium_carterae.1
MLWGVWGGLVVHSGRGQDQQVLWAKLRTFGKKSTKGKFVLALYRNPSNIGSYRARVFSVLHAFQCHRAEIDSHTVSTPAHKLSQVILASELRKAHKIVAYNPET